MATDPPYGVGYDPAWRHRVNPTQRTAVGRVMNDDRAEWTAAWRLFLGAVAYVWHAALKAPTVAADLEAVGFAIRRLRRSPKLDHFCSRELTQPQITI